MSTANSNPVGAHQSPLSLPLAAKPGRPARRPRAETYIYLAHQMFLEGTNFQAPVDAVEAGAKTIEDWSDCLTQARLESIAV